MPTVIIFQELNTDFLILMKYKIFYLQWTIVKVNYKWTTQRRKIIQEERSEMKEEMMGKENPGSD